MISNSLTYDFIKKFAGIKSLTKKVDPERVSNLKKEINDKCVQYEATLSNLKSQMRLLNSEVGNMLKMTDQHDNVESVESDIKIQSLESNTSVFKTTYGIIEILTLAIKSYKDLIERLDLDGKFIPGEGHLQFDYSFEDIQKMHMMSGMSSDIMNKYVEALLSIEGSKGYIAKVAWEIINELNSLNQLLVKRHGTDGVEIYGDVVSTDIAITLFKNVDNNGEIESVEDINMMSAFSRRKAEIISMLVYTDPMKAIIRSPNNIISVVESTMRVLWDWSDEFSRIFSDEVFKAKQYYSSSNLVGPKSFQDLMDEISDFDPNLVKFKSSSKFMTSEEKFYVEFINTTIKGIVELMKDEGSDQEQLVNFILSRKVVLNKRNKNKCTFYKCKIGEGNRFKQIPPGMLTIVPDDKPNASIDEIWGQGFDEVKDHLDSINMSVEWHDIFLATSPSKSADKSNMLLVGPQGCGKTQVLRAIGSDEDSISIFAQGSDFLTCWMGEAEKNPKRLFEGAAKLQRDTGKHVYILIDEADSVMKDSSLMKHGDVNLTLEFQICMDGVLNYPNITIVAATNHLGHMPSPIIRRFSKVLIVGELTKEDRIKVIKHYLDYMPIKGFKNDHWTDFAERLEGSTGDIIRKIVDHIWRTKITSFVKNNKKEAREVLDILRKDGDKFELSKFDEEKREEFKSSLSKFFHIEPSDVNKSITMHLDNIGIQTEIETAVAVYEEAHKLVKSFNKNKVLM